MLDFKVNHQTCTKCGQCIADCLATIISMGEDGPFIVPEKEASCYRCQHCFTVCPTGSISIFGLDPEKSLPLSDNLPDALQMELLIKGRRAVRQYKPENLEPEVMQRLLEVTSHAPTGRNDRQLRFTVVDDRDTLAKLREEVMNGLGRIIREKSLPKGREFFADMYRAWEDNGIDILFRGAPHLLMISAPSGTATPLQDCLIAMTTFELFAQTLGVGTVWDGLVKWAICDLMPEFRSRLGVPEDHTIGYVMVFGKPAVHYARTAQRETAQIHRID
ncbi:MAG: nitroreductase family protein [Desulfuromonadales bacterium]|nr:nitroreductase family protein [Desulfuromonadales bacterium]